MIVKLKASDDFANPGRVFFFFVFLQHLGENMDVKEVVQVAMLESLHGKVNFDYLDR
jgi:hypothetical protein